MIVRVNNMRTEKKIEVTYGDASGAINPSNCQYQALSPFGILNYIRSKREFSVKFENSNEREFIINNLKQNEYTCLSDTLDSGYILHDRDGFIEIIQEFVDRKLNLSFKDFKKSFT